MSEEYLLHESVPPEEIHKPYSFEYSNHNERLNATEPSSNDRGKLALVLSDNTIWLLVNHEPLTWKECLTGDSGTKPVGPALGDLTGEFPFPSVVPDSHLHTPGVSIPAYPVSLPPNGPAGGHLRGSYPNPLLSSTGVVSGIYVNPTLTIDSTGRISSAVSKIAGDPNLAKSMGSGSHVYSHKDLTTKELNFRSISLKPLSGLQLDVTEEEISIGTPNLAKLSGSSFTGSISAPFIDSQLIHAKTINSPLFNAGGPVSYFLPDARNGNNQVVVMSGSVTIDNISYAEPGMCLTFFIRQTSTPITSSTFSSKYKFAKGRTKTLSTITFTVDVIKVYVLSSDFYVTEIIKEIG